MALAIPRTSTEETLLDFVRGMPRSYAKLFDAAAMEQHLLLVNERGQRVAHTGVLSSDPDTGVALCIVADARPGLLSLVSDALFGQDLEITTAHVFQRATRSRRKEALLCLWVERTANSGSHRHIDQEDLRDITYALTQLIEQQQQRDETDQQRISDVELSTAPRVYYDTQALRSGEFVLVIQAPDCAGLLLAVTRALYREGAEIIASEVRTENGVAKDRFTLSAGSRGGFTPDRLADIQQGTLLAIRRLVARRLEA